jgi:hypothetical protein
VSQLLFPYLVPLIFSLLILVKFKWVSQNLLANGFRHISPRVDVHFDAHALRELSSDDGPQSTGRPFLMPWPNLDVHFIVYRLYDVVLGAGLIRFGVRGLVGLRVINLTLYNCFFPLLSVIFICISSALWVDPLHCGPFRSIVNAL